MATKVSPVALKADAWRRGPAGGDIAVPCSGGTSVTLRREDPFVYVRPALHGVWPDEAQLTAAQLRTLAARLEELAEAIDPGGFASADEAVAELERAAEDAGEELPFAAEQEADARDDTWRQQWGPTTATAEGLVAWQREVRDVAEAAEAAGWLHVLKQGKCRVEYRIAPVGRWGYAVAFGVMNATGGRSHPWEAYRDRGACLEAVADVALDRLGGTLPAALRNRIEKLRGADGEPKPEWRPLDRKTEAAPAATVERTAEGEAETVVEVEGCGDRPSGEKPSFPPRIASSVSGPLLDAIEEGLVRPPAPAEAGLSAENLAPCFVCRTPASKAPCDRCQGARFAGSVTVPGAEGPVKVWVLPDGRGWALCELGRLGNWHVRDLPEADYRPTVDELEWAIADQLSLNADVREWYADEEFHWLELCRVYRVEVRRSRPTKKKPADVSDTNIDTCELHETPAGKGPWRKVLLAGKFPPEQVRVLKAAGIETVGALADYVASGKDVLAIRGVNEGLDRLIVGCLRYHWRREVMNDLEAPLPAWLEPAARQEKAPKKRKGVKK